MWHRQRQRWHLGHQHGEPGRLRPSPPVPRAAPSGALFDPTRTLYLYFRNTDIASTTPWQPGTTQNWLNALFYNPSGVGGPAVHPDQRRPDAPRGRGSHPGRPEACVDTRHLGAAC